MRREPEPTESVQDMRDITIPAGCMLCGGDLAVRVTAMDARSVCPSCRWISRPHLRREDGGIVVTHPAAGLA